MSSPKIFATNSSPRKARARVGGIKLYEVSEQLVREGVTDYIAFSRPLLRESDLVNRWKSGDTRRSKCGSDNACLGGGGDGVRCPHREKKENPS